MRSIICGCILLLVTVFSSAQSISKLDSEFGYGGFKFESSAAEYGNITLTKTSDPCKYYLVDAANHHFGYAAYKVDLEFCSDKLKSIWIEFNPSSEEVYFEILETLEETYGKSQDLVIKLSEDKSRHWDGKKTMLVIKYYGVREDAGIVKVGILLMP